MQIIPSWLSGYRRAWLGADGLAGVIIWSVVVPQAVAYAQIAGLPPQAGLVAAPGALLGYALLGSSRYLVVSATTATAAVSAAVVAPLAGNNTGRFAALSATLALMAAVVFIAGGVLKLGGVMDLVSKPVMTGFLFGLGLTIAIGQLPKILGVESGSGDFFDKLGQLLGDLGDAHGLTVVVGVISVGLLVTLTQWVPTIPGSLVVLVLAIALSALTDLAGRGVEVVGELPVAVPNLEWPHFTTNDVVTLLPAAFGILLLSAEGVGVSRSMAVMHKQSVDTNRDLVGFGVSNLLAGLSHGFVQSGGASQTAAAERSGGKTQLASIVAAALVLLTGAFLAPLFENLPQATLGAIVIVAVAHFLRVRELMRYLHIRTSAFVLALVTLAGVLAFGVLPGLLLGAGLSLGFVVRRLSRPPVGTLARDPATGAWGRADRHPEWATPRDVLVVRVEGALFYANSDIVKDAVLHLLRAAVNQPAVVVLELSESPELDLQTLDALSELTDALHSSGVELRLASVRGPTLEIMDRGGLTERVRVEPTVDAAVEG